MKRNPGRQTRPSAPHRPVPRLARMTPEQQVRCLSRALESLRDAVYITDRHHTIIYANPAITCIQGYEPEAVVGKKAWQIFEGIPGNPPSLVALIRRQARGGFWIGRVFNRTSSGRIFPVQLIENTIYGEKEEVLGYIGISRDVSEQLRLERSLEEEKEKYRLVVENSLTGIYILSPEGRVLFTNRVFENLSGYPAKELLGKNVFNFIHPDDRKRVRSIFGRRLAGKPSPEQYRVRAIHRGGPVCWIEIRATRITYRGKPAVLGNFIDITESQRSAAELRESEERYRTTLEAIQDPLHVVDADLRVVLFNRAFTGWNRRLGLETRAVGRKLDELFPFLPDQVFREYREVFRTGKTVVTEERTVIKGEEFLTETVKVPIFEKGKVGRVITIVRDITDRKRSEARLRETSKLEAVGTMSLSIAHEFNNILMGISGYAQLALADLRDREMSRRALDVILRQTQRGKLLIQRLGVFGRREKPHLEPVDLTRLLDEVVSLQEQELRVAGVRIVRDYRPPSPVLADYAQMEQVFFNLVKNACQAIEPKGKGKITLFARDRGESAEARVSDTGIGIASADLKKIFDPFFTTKEREKGDKVPSLGLGLWVARKIVSEHRGTLTVKSAPGQGTTFIITLPRAKGMILAAGGEKERGKSAGGLPGREILVVDDEEALLEMYRLYLTEKGIGVTQAHGGEEALRRCRKRRFDIIFLDYVMPGLSGLELVRKIATLSRGRIYIVTGKPIPREERKPFRRLVSGWLKKPLSLHRLTAVIEGG